MRIVSVFGGPIRKRNTELALEYFVKGFVRQEDDYSLQALKDKQISPCTACMACSATGVCVINDNMIEFYNAFDSSDVIILATPMYFNSVSAMTKAMIDRCQSYWAKIVLLKQKEKRKKYGVVIATAGSTQKKNEVDGIRLVTDLFFKAIGTECIHFIFIEGTDASPLENRFEELKKIELSANQLRETIENTDF